MTTLGLGLSIAKGSAARAFSPADLGSALKFWLRADLGITLNGATVSAWGDQSGTGDANKHATQGTAAEQPTYVASDAGYNGQATLSFDAGDWMQTGTWTSALAQPATHFLVGQGGSATFREATDGIDGGSRHSISMLNTGEPYLYAGAALFSGAASWIATKHIVGGVFAGGSSKIYVDSATASATGNAGAQSLTGVTIGGNFGGPSWAGKVAEIIICEGILSNALILQTMTYLAARYAVTLS